MKKLFVLLFLLEEGMGNAAFCKLGLDNLQTNYNFIRQKSN